VFEEHCHYDFLFCLISDWFRSLSNIDSFIIETFQEPASLTQTKRQASKQANKHQANPNQPNKQKNPWHEKF
jgi:hypothetical protein